MFLTCVLRELNKKQIYLCLDSLLLFLGIVGIIGALHLSYLYQSPANIDNIDNNQEIDRSDILNIKNKM